MAEAIVFALPEAPAAGDRSTNWWYVVDGEVADRGESDEWVHFAASMAAARSQVALAPASLVRMHFSGRPPGVSTDRQAAAVANVAVLDSSLGDPQSLHAVSAPVDDGSVATAVVADRVMRAWLDWAAEAGADPTHVVPAAALVPTGDDWVMVEFGGDRLVGRTGAVMPYEPSLASAIVGDARVETLDDEATDALIAGSAEKPPLDLRTGKFARRRRLVVDRRRLRELAYLAALLPVLTTALGVAGIVKLDRSTAALDRESVAIAERALGHPVTLETARPELINAAGNQAYGGLMAPLTELYNVIKLTDGVSATQISYSADGTLSVTLAAPAMDSINSAVVALQRDGYSITSVARQASDGRSMADVTIRSHA